MRSVQVLIDPSFIYIYDVFMWDILQALLVFGPYFFISFLISGCLFFRVIFIFLSAL